MQGHPLVTLPPQRYASLVQLSQADVVRLLKYLAFLARFTTIILYFFENYQTELINLQNWAFTDCPFQFFFSCYII